MGVLEVHELLQGQEENFHQIDFHSLIPKLIKNISMLEIGAGCLRSEPWIMKVHLSLHSAPQHLI